MRELSHFRQMAQLSLHHPGPADAPPQYRFVDHDAQPQRPGRVEDVLPGEPDLDQRIELGGRQPVQ